MAPQPKSDSSPAGQADMANIRSISAKNSIASFATAGHGRLKKLGQFFWSRPFTVLVLDEFSHVVLVVTVQPGVLEEVDVVVHIHFRHSERKDCTRQVRVTMVIIRLPSQDLVDFLLQYVSALPAQTTMPEELHPTHCTDRTACREDHAPVHHTHPTGPPQACSIPQ